MPQLVASSLAVPVICSCLSMLLIHTLNNLDVLLEGVSETTQLLAAPSLLCGDIDNVKLSCHLSTTRNL